MFMIVICIRPEIRGMVLSLPKKFWCFLIGLDTYQYDNPLDSENREPVAAEGEAPAAAEGEAPATADAELPVEEALPAQ